jgi:hypothetical protein
VRRGCGVSVAGENSWEWSRAQIASARSEGAGGGAYPAREGLIRTKGKGGAGRRVVCPLKEKEGGRG